LSIEIDYMVEHGSRVVGDSTDRTEKNDVRVLGPALACLEEGSWTRVDRLGSVLRPWKTEVDEIFAGLDRLERTMWQSGSVSCTMVCVMTFCPLQLIVLLVTRRSELPFTAFVACLDYLTF
jgi:hypothetical protein